MDTPEQGSKKWLSVKDAAKYLGVSAHTVRDMVDSGKLTYYRPGNGRGKISFRGADLEAYLEGVRFGPKPKVRPSLPERRSFPPPKSDHGLP
jgi:excisionase family DNA binding protein